MNWNDNKRIDSAASGILAIAVSAFMALSLVSVAIAETSAKSQPAVGAEALANHAAKSSAPAAGGSIKIAAR